MNLDEQQRAQVAQWIEQGLKLSEIQIKLASVLGLTMTYMDVRFLIDDLKLRPKDPVVIAPPTPPAPVAPPTSAAPGAAPVGGALPPGGAVSLTVDQIARPGTMVSGNVTFSDGKGAGWYLDQTGRLGLAAEDKTYRPPPADIAEFQTLLQSELAKLGI